MIPTLEEVLELLHGRTGLNIEIKTIPLRRNRIGIVERCSSMIQQYHAESYVLVSSFHHQHVNLTKRILPVVMTGILIHPLKHIGRSAFQAAHKEKADFIILGGGALRKNVVGKAHERRLEVGEFTVNTRRRFERALRYNVDAIFTDDPGRMIRLRSEMK
jgi:glycerophosphoryl diester phosphodiesterase